ncbi:Uncharacterized protein Adt_26260 [Abeliophyllum distichum]|uniref:Uncharacterized protein n=1 Tax=Abeliophyllum distichum TaxID=126358 RepID=A0ABD1RQD7_9LAMI
MHLAAASLGFLSLLLPESAEARTRNADIRKKIFEKLEELREKDGLSRPKVEGQEKNPKDEAEAEEKNRKPSIEIEGKKPTSAVYSSIIRWRSSFAPSEPPKWQNSGNKSIVMKILSLSLHC